MRRLGLIALGLIVACGAFGSAADEPERTSSPDGGTSSSGNEGGASSSGGSSSSSGGSSSSSGGIERDSGTDGGAPPDDKPIRQMNSKAGASAVTNVLTVSFDQPASSDHVVIVGAVALDGTANPIDAVKDDSGASFTAAAKSKPTTGPHSEIWWSTGHASKDITVTTKSTNGRLAVWILEGTGVIEADDNLASSPSIDSNQLDAPTLNIITPATIVLSVGAIGSGTASFAGVTTASKFVALPLTGGGPAPTAAAAYRLFDTNDDYGASWKMQNANGYSTSAVTVSFIP